jgi:Peroxisomal membrane protein (Pex16)
MRADSELWWNQRPEVSSSSSSSSSESSGSCAASHEAAAQVGSQAGDKVASGYDRLATKSAPGQPGGASCENKENVRQGQSQAAAPDTSAGPGVSADAQPGAGVGREASSAGNAAPRAPEEPFWEREHRRQHHASQRTAELQRAGRRLIWYGEVLAIVRPLIYVSLLRRWGRRSWLPWLGSLACDLLSRLLTLRGHAMLAQVRGLHFMT